MLDKYSSEKLIRMKWPGYIDKRLNNMKAFPLSLREQSAIIDYASTEQFLKLIKFINYINRLELEKK